MEDRNCPLIGNIKEEVCFDINMVVDGLAPTGTINEKVLKIENYKEICQKCKYHNNE